MVVRAATEADADAVVAIYNHYVAHTIVTFEEAAVTGAEMARRIEMIAAASLPWLIAERRGEVVGVIALPNDASVALHEKFGLSKVAHLKEVGFKLGRWIDVGYWERILELDIRTAERVTVPRAEVGERHPVSPAHPRIDLVNLAGEAVGRQPLRHGIRIEESSVDAVHRRGEHAVKSAVPVELDMAIISFEIGDFGRGPRSGASYGPR